MRVWFDTEFIEDGRTIDLLSIGMVREDGTTFYAQNRECELHRASEWVVANVFPGLGALGWYGIERPDTAERYYAETSSAVGSVIWRTRAEIADAIREFVGPSPEFWADFADYDWVALCQLYGRMIDLPDGWPMFCLDIRQTMYEYGVPRSLLPPDPPNAHYALADALWARDAWHAIYDPEEPT